MLFTLPVVDLLLKDRTLTLTGMESQMEARDAVQLAKQYVFELFRDEGIAEIGLEEIEGERGDLWTITIGFSRDWDRNLSSVLGGQRSRSYKVIRINDKDGRVLSIKDRNLPNALGAYASK